MGITNSSYQLPGGDDRPAALFNPENWSAGRLCLILGRHCKPGRNRRAQAYRRYRPRRHKSKGTKALTSRTIRLAAAGRGDRRRQLLARGLWIGDNQPAARRSARMKPSRSIHSTLKRMAGRAGLTRPNYLSFSIQSKSTPKGAKVELAKMTKMPVPRAFHVVVARKAAKKAPVPQIVALVAKEAGGKIVSMRELHSR